MEQIIADLEANEYGVSFIIVPVKQLLTRPFGSLNNASVITESKEIQWAVAYELEHGVRWLNFMRGRTGSGNTSTIRRLLLRAGAQAMQQPAGINVTSYYLPTVLITSVGLGEKLARLLAACNSMS